MTASVEVAGAASIISFMAGAAFSYWRFNGDAALFRKLDRLSVAITRQAENFALDLDMAQAQFRRILPPLTGPQHTPLVSREEVLEYYRWAVGRGRGKDPVALTALAILCEKILRLTRTDALQALLQTKTPEELKTFLARRGTASNTARED